VTWTRKPLEEVAEFCLGKMLDANKNRGQSMPYLANINVRWGRFDLDDLRQMRFEEKELDRFGLSSGDIVMCEGGEPGRCAIWQDQLPGMMFQKALHRIRPHGEIDSRFLFYLFLKMGRNDEFAGLFTGSTIKHLPKEKLAKVVVAFPEIVLQQRIAAVLSRYDDLIENNRRRITLLEQAAQLLYEEWFVRFRFPGHERAKFISGLPEGWEQRKLGSILTLQRGFDLPSASRIDGDVPVYGSTGVLDHHNVSKVTVPTVITGRSGSLGQVCYADQPCWPLNTCLWVKEFKGVSPYFAYHLLKAMDLSRMNGGASVPTLDRKAVHRVDVVLPSGAVLSQFDEYVGNIFSGRKILDQQNEKLVQARDLLLPRLMSGEVEV